MYLDLFLKANIIFGKKYVGTPYASKIEMAIFSQKRQSRTDKVHKSIKY